MVRKLLSISLLSLVVLWLSVHSVEAQVSSITTNLLSAEELVYATRIRSAEPSGGEMAVAYPSQDQQTVYVSTFSTTANAWSELLSINNSLIKGADEVEIRQFGIIPLRTYWVVHWVNDYFTSGGEFVGSTYEIAEVWRDGGGYGIGPLQGSWDRDAITSHATQAGEAFLEIIPAWQPTYNGYIVVWRDGDSIYANDWFVDWYDLDTNFQLEDGDITSGFFQSIYSIIPYETAAYDYERYPFFIASQNNKNLRLSKFDVPKGSDSIESVYTNTLNIQSTDGELLLPLLGDNEEFHLFFRDGGKIKWKYYASTGSVSGSKTLVTLTNSAAVGETNAIYNSYGEGQVVVTWYTGTTGDYTLHFNYWTPKKGWSKQQVLDKEIENISQPLIQGFKNGRLQISWENDSIFYETTYSPSTKAWSNPQTVLSGGTIHPVDLAKISLVSGSGNESIIYFKKGSQRYLRRWKMGLNKDFSNYVLPKNFKLIDHTITKRKDFFPWYFALIQDGQILKSIIAEEDSLFKE